jgi:hypothetical protein
MSSGSGGVERPLLQKGRSKIMAFRHLEKAHGRCTLVCLSDLFRKESIFDRYN